MSPTCLINNRICYLGGEESCTEELLHEAGIKLIYDCTPDGG